MTDRLAGKVIVVGGGAGGTGEAISRRLAAEGASVLIGDLNMDGAKTLAAELTAAGGTASAFQFSNKDSESVAALVDHGYKTYGRLDGVHIIAGNMDAMREESDVMGISQDIWLSQLQAHLFAPAQAARTAIPLMRAGGGGSIIFTSSNACRAALPEMIGYQTAKSGVETLTRHVARTFGKDGIRCNCLCYGVVLTDKAKVVLPQDYQDRMLATNWSRRLGKPTDMAGIAALLHSEDGEWINGQVIDVNGGMLIRG